MKKKFKVQSSKIQILGSKIKDQRPKAEDRQTKSVIRNPQSAIVFGVLPVLEALRANSRRIEKIYVAEGARERRLSEIFEVARLKGILVNKISRENLANFVEPGANHQGVVAFTAAADYVSADEIFDSIGENALLLILDGVEDPRNLGAILRVAEGAGTGGVFIPERRAVGLTETVAKSSAGATEYVKVAKVANVNRLIEELKKRKIWVVGTSAEAETVYTDWDWRAPSALVLGGEGQGLHRLVAENCDVLVKIPMYGKIESLNVSVAAGVILFEAVRQRAEREKGRKPRFKVLSFN
jgi:23S rRNA (guanosine2251-2'-O)-methyltransferase